MSTDPMTHHTKSIPILVDNSLNRAFAIKYIVFAFFGLSAVFFGIPAVAELWGGVMAFITGIMVFLTATTAAIAAWWTEKGVRWQKAGIYSGYAFIFSAGLYAMALLILTFQGDARRASAAIISLALVVMPAWYIRYLVRRVGSGTS